MALLIAGNNKRKLVYEKFFINFLLIIFCNEFSKCAIMASNMYHLIKVVDLIVGVETHYNLLETRLAQYIVLEDSLTPVFNLEVSEEEIAKLKIKAPNLTSEECEYIISGAEFYKKILDYNAFFLHASAVVVNNVAYAFSANSGVGKSTHTKLYLKYFPDSYIINDDKPVIKYKDDKFYIYGTPWSGKDDCSRASSVLLGGLCFIKRGIDNKVIKLERKDALIRILTQTLRIKSIDKYNILLNLLDKFLKTYDVYEIYADISKDAVLKSYEALSKNNKGEDIL